jgi:hypothetical protein
MAAIGLASIEKALNTLQNEILILRGGSSVTPTDGILGIRTKFLEQKIDKLNQEFTKLATEDLSLVKLVVLAMQHVEEHGYKYAEYLSCSNSAAFKEELCLNLLTKIGDYEIDMVKELIQTICSASKQILNINSKKPTQSILALEPETQLVVRKPVTHGKLKRFLHRTTR